MKPALKVALRRCRAARRAGIIARRPVRSLSIGVRPVSRALTRLQAGFLGLVVLSGFSLGGWGLFQVGERQRLWNEHFTLFAGFPRVQGVGVGTPVRVRGLEAGVVAAVELPPANHPGEPLTLCLHLERRFQPLVFVDAVATILQEG